MNPDLPRKRVLVVGEHPLLRGLLAEEKSVHVVGHTLNIGMVPSMVAASAADALVLSVPARTEKDVALLLGYLRVSAPRLFVVVVAAGVQGVSHEEWQQAGADIVVREGDDYQGLVAAIARAPSGSTPERVVVDLEKPPHRAANPTSTAGEVIMVVGFKGGVGKTFLAVNLAAYLSVAGRGKVALVDLDLDSGDAAVHLDLLGSPSIVELLPHLPDPTPGTVERLLCQHQPSGIRLLPAPARPELAELVSREQVRRILELLRREFTLVVVDTPPEGNNDLVYEVMEEAERVMLVSTMDAASLRLTRITVETMEKLGLPVAQRVCLVLNRCRREGPISLSQIEEFLGARAVATIDDEPRLIEASIFAGRPLVLTHKNHPVAGSLEKLARLLMGEEARPLRQPGAMEFWRRWRRS